MKQIATDALEELSEIVKKKAASQEEIDAAFENIQVVTTVVSEIDIIPPEDTELLEKEEPVNTNLFQPLEPLDDIGSTWEERLWKVGIKNPRVLAAQSAEPLAEKLSNSTGKKVTPDTAQKFIAAAAKWVKEQG